MTLYVGVSCLHLLLDRVLCSSSCAHVACTCGTDKLSTAARLVGSWLCFPVLDNVGFIWPWDW